MLVQLSEKSTQGTAMLKLNGVEIYLQNGGTVLGVFLKGPDKKAIEEQYFSFYNHEATGGELEWWSDTCALFWIYSSAHISAEDKLVNALQKGVWAKLMNAGSKGRNPWPESCIIAEQQFAAMERVTWFKPEVVWDMYDIGDSVTAEKGTGNFNDDVLGQVVYRDGVAKLEFAKDEDETESYSEGLQVSRPVTTSH